MNLTRPPPPSQNRHAVGWHCTAESKQRVAHYFLLETVVGYRSTSAQRQALTVEYYTIIISLYTVILIVILVIIGIQSPTHSFTLGLNQGLF